MNAPPLALGAATACSIAEHDQTTEASSILMQLEENAHLPAPPERPSTLPLSSIRQHPELFQPRKLAMDERHIQDLVRAIKMRGQIDPVLIIQVGPEAVLIDGHHRLAAYEEAKRVEAIPVSYFDGSLQEAVLEAGRANSKTKLPMPTRDRQNYAWRLVKMGTYSKKQISEAAAVSDGQVAIMRRVRRTLGKDACGYATWFEAYRTYKGHQFVTMSDDEREEWMEAQANDYADRLSKAFGSKLANNPELAARALSIHLGRRLREIVDELGPYLGDTVNEVNDDF